MAGGSVNTTAKSVIEDRPMTLFQFLIVLLCIIVNISDAFDTSVLGVVAPVIMKDLGMKPDLFGVLLGISSLGVVFGALVIAPLADKFGRRSSIVILLGLLSIVTLLTPLAATAPFLLFARLLTGVCIGGVAPSLGVTVIEFSNRKWGSFLLSNLYMSFAIGSALVALIARATVEDHGWQMTFWISGGFNFAVFLMCLFFLPESISFLMSRRPKGALEKINKSYKRMGLEPLTELPPKVEIDAKQKVGIAAVMTPTLITISILIWFSSFTHFFSGSMVGGLGAKILVDIGVPLKDAVGLGAVTSPASAIGILLLGALAGKFDPLKLTVGAFMLAAAGHLCYGLMPPQLPIVYTVASVTAFGHAAAFGGLLICVARFYGPDTRGTAIGWTQGIGRLGTMIGSTSAGQMMAHQWDRSAMYATMSAICVAGGIALFATRINVAPQKKAAAPAA